MYIDRKTFGGRKMNNIYHALLSSVCITIPEYIFLVVVTLRLMGRKEMLDFYDFKNNLFSIFTIAIPPAIILDILNYTFILSSSINKIISLTITYFLLYYILKKRSFIDYPKLYQKAFQYFIYSLLLAIAIDTITYPIILKLVDMKFDIIKLNIYLIILCSLPSRVIDIMILTCIFIKKNNKFQIDIGNYLFNNKFFMRVSEILVLGLVIFEAYFVKLLIFNNLLDIIDTMYEQLFIVVGVTFLIPGFIISIVYLCVNYCVMIINSGKQAVRDD